MSAKSSEYKLQRAERIKPRKAAWSKRMRERYLRNRHMALIERLSFPPVEKLKPNPRVPKHEKSKAFVKVQMENDLTPPAIKMRVKAERNEAIKAKKEVL